MSNDSIQMHSLTLTLSIEYAEAQDRSGRCYCGADFAGTLEAFDTSVAYAAIDTHGVPYHCGETNSDFIYDGQYTVDLDDGRTVFVCFDGHNYVMPLAIAEGL